MLRPKSMAFSRLDVEKRNFVSVKTTADKDYITKKAVAKHPALIKILMELSPIFCSFRILVRSTLFLGERTICAFFLGKKGKDYKRLTFYLIPTEEFEDRNEDADNSSAEECAKDQGIAKYFTGSAAGCSTKERIDLSDDDKKLSYVDAPASLEGKFYACTIS